MTRMFLLICTLFVGSAQAAYVCQPDSPRDPPDMVGKTYPVARKILVGQGWEPVRKSSHSPPEMESCDTRVNVTCDFVFEDTKSGYALVVQASGKADMLRLRVTGYAFRCHP